MDRIDDRFGPGDDTWEDRLGPDDETWLRTRVERWFDRNLTLVGSLAAGLVLALVGFGSLAALSATLDDVTRLGRPPVVATTTATVVGVPYDREHPFAGTAVEADADGAAGVVVPEVRPSQFQRFSPEQVTAAYARVREVVVMARLDRRVVLDHDVEPLVSLFAADQRDELRRRFADPGTAWVATRVAAEARLLDVEPKVSGWMRAEETPSGDLVVRTTFSFTYAFDADEPLESTAEARAMTIHEADYVVRGDALWLGETRDRFFAASCIDLDRGFLAPTISDPRGIPCVR